MGGGQKPHTPIACVVLAAGRGTRMRSARAKVAHALAGRPLLAWVLAAAQALEPAKIIVVGPPDAPEVARIAAPHPVAVQAARDGTGGALAAALPALEGFCGPVLVLNVLLILLFWKELLLSSFDPGLATAITIVAPASNAKRISSQRGLQQFSKPAGGCSPQRAMTLTAKGTQAESKTPAGSVG